MFAEFSLYTQRKIDKCCLVKESNKEYSVEPHLLVIRVDALAISQIFSSPLPPGYYLPPSLPVNGKGGISCLYILVSAAANFYVNFCEDSFRMKTFI
jgi:hypothetical protein